MSLIDKNLSSSIGYTLDNTGDFTITTDETSTLLAAQNRILSDAGSWMYNDDYGSIMKSLRDTPIQLISNEQIKGYVELALQPMIDESRVLRVGKVKITSRYGTSIQVEIEIVLEFAEGILDINLTL